MTLEAKRVAAFLVGHKKRTRDNIISRAATSGEIHDLLASDLRALLALAAPAALPCHSPYCECDEGKCTHPGFYDARKEET